MAIIKRPEQGIAIRTFTRLTEVIRRPARTISELIGRATFRVKLFGANQSIDQTKTDYPYYDKLFRGLQPTFKLGGLFAKPMVDHKVAWSIGRGFTVKTGVDDVDEAVRKFLNREIDTIISWVRDSRKHGDAYLLVDVDGTLMQLNPDIVERIDDPMDYRTPIGWKVHNKTETLERIDEYYASHRVVTLIGDGVEALAESTPAEDEESTGSLGGFVRIGPNKVQAVFPNFRGVNPVVHLANDRGVNEIYGHSDAEALLNLLAEYDDTLLRLFISVKTASQPIPTIEGSTNPDAELKSITSDTHTYTNEDGEEVTENVVDLATLGVVATSGRFELRTAQAYTNDGMNVLGETFQLIGRHTGVPEWVWGGAIASSMASVQAQLPAWELTIELIRTFLKPRLIALVDIWIRTAALFEFFPVVDPEDIVIRFPDIAETFDETKLKYLTMLYTQGILGAEDTLREADIVDDPVEAIERQQLEADEERTRNQDDIDRLAAATFQVNGRFGNDEGSENDDSS